MSNMVSFTKVMRRDPVVAQHYTSWLHGAYSSFEQMLLSLCVSLWEQKEELLEKKIVDFSRFAPGSPAKVREMFGLPEPNDGGTQIKPIVTRTFSSHNLTPVRETSYGFVAPSSTFCGAMVGELKPEPEQIPCQPLPKQHDVLLTDVALSASPSIDLDDFVKRYSDTSFTVHRYTENGPGGPKEICDIVGMASNIRIATGFISRSLVCDLSIRADQDKRWIDSPKLTLVFDKSELPILVIGV